MRSQLGLQLQLVWEQTEREVVGPSAARPSAPVARKKHRLPARPRSDTVFGVSPAVVRFKKMVTCPHAAMCLGHALFKEQCVCFDTKNIERVLLIPKLTHTHTHPFNSLGEEVWDAQNSVNTVSVAIIRWFSGFLPNTNRLFSSSRIQKPCPNLQRPC